MCPHFNFTFGPFSKTSERGAAGTGPKQPAIVHFCCEYVRTRSLVTVQLNHIKRDTVQAVRTILKTELVILQRVLLRGPCLTGTCIRRCLVAGLIMVAAAAFLARAAVADASLSEGAGSSEAANLYSLDEAPKHDLLVCCNLQFSMTTSFYWQVAAPPGGPALGQIVGTPSLTWTPFKDTAVGSGTFIVSFQYHHFFGESSTSQQDRIGLITTPNDWLDNGYGHDQISYTHTMPGELRWLSVTVGQYSFNLFDDNLYASGAQTSFIGYALAQNGTSTYATAGVGAYLQATSPDARFLLSGGFQTASDITGTLLATGGFTQGKYAYFLAARWTPHFLGGGRYSLVAYTQPAVPNQPSRSQGISFSAAQSLGHKLGLFLRVNNASGAVTPIETSVAWGGVYQDPLRRNDQDQIGAGLFWNKTNHAVVVQAARAAEWGAEIYYNLTIIKGLQVTPDLQMFFDPARMPGASPAVVFTLRSTVFF